MKDKTALLVALQRDISERLKPICHDLSDENFDQLVRDIAAVKLKYGIESDLSASLRLQLEQLKSDSGNDGGDSSLT